MRFTTLTLYPCDLMVAQEITIRIHPVGHMYKISMQATNNHLSVDDVVDAHQRVLLISTITLQAVLSRGSAVENRVAACWCTTWVY